jgi:hypothetical protein
MWSISSAWSTLCFRAERSPKDVDVFPEPVLDGAESVKVLGRGPAGSQHTEERALRGHAVQMVCVSA